MAMDTGLRRFARSIGKAFQIIVGKIDGVKTDVAGVKTDIAEIGKGFAEINKRFDDLGAHVVEGVSTHTAEVVTKFDTFGPQIIEALNARNAEVIAHLDAIEKRLPAASAGDPFDELAAGFEEGFTNKP